MTMVKRSLLLQMLGKETEASRPGDIGAGLVVTCPLVAVEAMLRAGIDMGIDVRALGLDGLDIAERNVVVLFAEVKLVRPLRLLVDKGSDHAAIITDGRRQA